MESKPSNTYVVLYISLVSSDRDLARDINKNIQKYNLLLFEKILIHVII